jgi:glyoxylase-like metal-dependent hydrolase (beta-lactamase superfamily II)
MKLHIIETGYFKLDGGAMFGVVPKALWSRTNPADNSNRIELAARSLLIEDGNRLILIDTGMGNKQDDRFFQHFGLYGNDSLDHSIKEAGFSRADITDVFLTHLHFDHCGGAVRWNEKKTTYELSFPNAHYWSNKQHWEWAVNPNEREKASFLTENLLPIQESGQLNFIETPETSFASDCGLGFGVLFVNGHTEKQMIPHISCRGKTLVFMADLLPTAGHLPLPYIMGYDVRPLQTLEEKKRFLNRAADENFVLFMQHDANNPLITVQHTDRGVRLYKSLTPETLNTF